MNAEGRLANFAEPWIRDDSLIMIAAALTAPDAGRFMRRGPEVKTAWLAEMFGIEAGNVASLTQL